MALRRLRRRARRLVGTARLRFALACRRRAKPINPERRRAAFRITGSILNAARRRSRIPEPARILLALYAASWIVVVLALVYLGVPPQ